MVRVSADQRQRYDRLAPIYDLIDLAEIAYKRTFRPRLFADLKGLVLDAGIGTGRNVPFYPSDAKVVGIDLSPRMLSGAAARARQQGKEVGLAAMDARYLGFPDCTFDAVVAAFMMCVLDEQQQAPALREYARVTKPGGEVRILDYGMPRQPLARLAIKAYAPFQRLVYGAGYEFHTERYLADAGLELLREDALLGRYVRLLVGRKG